MKTLDVALVRLFQFLMMLFFTFVVFLWYGCAALIPLALWLNLTDFFAVVFSPIMSTIMALAIIGAIGIYLSKISHLVELFLSTGVELIKLANTCVNRMGHLAESVKHDTVPEETQVEIRLRDRHS